MNQDLQTGLSIVIVPICGNESLLRSLQSVAELPVQQIVVVAVEAPGQEVLRLVNDRSVSLLIRPGSSVPERRAHGVAASTGDWVAILEDTVTVDESWFVAASEAMRNGDGAAFTGPVRFSESLPPAVLALACTEYGRFTENRLFLDQTGSGPAAPRPVERGVGVNLFYRKDKIEDHMGPDGLIESELDHRLTLCGEQILAYRGLAVCLEGVPKTATRLSTRVAHGRLYGGLLRRRQGMISRALHLIRCFLLPLVLSIRAARAIPSKTKSRMRVLAHIVLMETSWSIGEFTGVLLGPGRAGQHWV